MHLALGIPLAFYGLHGFLVTQKWRPLWIAVAGFMLTALSTLYYAIILALALATFAVVYALVHWRGWKWETLGKVAVAGAVQAVILAPFLWPYVRTRSELGFERVLAQQPVRHSADILTYWETRSTWLYQSPFTTDAETVLFMGFVTSALVLLMISELRRDRLAMAVGVLGPLAIGVASIGITLLWRPAQGSPGWYLPLAGTLFALFFGAAGFAMEGRRRWREGIAQRELTTQEWVLALLYLVFFCFALSLGPAVRFAGQPVGEGLYGYAYIVLPFLRAIRVLTRIGVIVVFAFSLLAAFGAARLATRFQKRVPAVATYSVLSILLLVEFWSAPLAYAPAPWPPEMPAYQRLAQLEEGTAVLEVPLFADKEDANEMLSSLYYRKFLVNGVSGFVPPFTVGLAQNLKEPIEVFPSAQTIAMMRSIYPLRHILVHRGAMTRPERLRWERLRESPPPSLRLLGTYEASDLYELLSTPERGEAIRRQFSFDFVRRHPVTEVSLRRAWREDAAAGGAPEIRDGSVRSFVEVTFNGSPLESFELTDDLHEATWRLAPPFRHAAANELHFSHHYEPPPVSPEDIRYRLGESGPALEFDLLAMSDTLHPGSTSSLMVNGRRTTLKQPGYNLAVLDPETGEVLSRASFSTDRDPQASTQLFYFIEELPVGSIVVAATSGNASTHLGAEARRALRACGSALDLSQSPGAAHVMIGYKGAEPGSVPEQVGGRLVRVVVGQDPERLTMELVDFDMVEEEARN